MRNFWSGFARRAVQDLELNFLSNEGEGHHHLRLKNSSLRILTVTKEHSYISDYNRYDAWWWNSDWGYRRSFNCCITNVRFQFQVPYLHSKSKYDDAAMEETKLNDKDRWTAQYKNSWTISRSWFLLLYNCYFIS